MSSAIEFENISKQYRLGLVSTGTLSHDLNRFWQTKVLRREDPYLKVGEVNDRAHKGDSEYVWALKDINFKVEQGDVVGIIGRNGAGKSTLLKLLSRVTAPTTGTIRARGRIASLLEVGTGFHPEMTGRENIYMNGAIMGMSRAEITRKLDEIVDFSGCERYLDTPVKRYSSGMTVRLGFAIAAHLEPEILVVDEVLAVGDAEFQKKAIGKMQDVSRGEGRTVLFVSHNMGAVKNLCKRGIVLNQGQVAFDGGVEDAVDYYVNSKSENNVCEKQICDINHINPAKEVQFLSVKFEKNCNEFATDEEIVFIFSVYANKTIENCRINLTIFSIDGTPIGSISNTETFSIQKKENRKIRLILQNSRLAMGNYEVSFSIGTGNYQTCQTDFDIISKILSFKITKPTLCDSISVSQWNSVWGKIMFNSKTEVIEQ
ncbi:MAG: ABC transporter ATP-binding protein [Fibrobacter sp.]|uniref:ABC transporter ATP-binding protein n=1 Tax=Fibrobacter sp. TaxID=35828 RepID=UPI0025B8B93D|nr:ABC transporter ATP-binding protein [Fibrobacter sp.]MBQ3715768.1 ABC transporter ATP-binding protein [Fibrobacter sp.]MBQ7078164.1 ABC transporter ATP-binding protein [Fibrobacter sp.]